MTLLSANLPLRYGKVVHKILQELKPFEKQDSQGEILENMEKREALLGLQHLWEGSGVLRIPEHSMVPK